MDNGTRQPAPFEPLSNTRAELGESPVWSPDHAAYWWVDIHSGKLLRTARTGLTSVWETPETPGFVQCIGASVFVGMQTGVFAFEPGRARFSRCAALETPGMRFNDACADSRGRLWAGTMDMENRGANGVLYLFDPARRSLTPKLDGFRIINGLAWDARHRRLFFSDSHPSVQTVWTCAVSDDDTLSLQTEFARFDRLDGRPDGAALDHDGHYWIAGVGGASLYRFAPSGVLGARFSVPVQSPTKPAFGPETATGRDLVLTSFKDADRGGRLMVWHMQLPTAALDPERDPDDEITC